jgi:very-short-patch-repair endonuclease
MRDTWQAERLVARLGGSNDGVVVSTAALAEGVSLRALARLRGRGVLVPIAKGVDRVRDHPFDLRCRCRAALAIAGPGSALGLRTASRYHGSWRHRDLEDVEVLVPRGRDHRTTVGRIVQTTWLPPDHVVVVDGFPVTSLARTFFDLCGDPDPGLHLRHPVHERRMKQLYNDFLGRRGMTFTMAVLVLSVLAGRGRAGTVLVRTLLEHFGPKHTPTESDVETLFHELVRTSDLPEPARQVAILGPRGWIGTVDFCWPDAWHIVEVDSSWHDGPDDQAVDQQRDVDLREAGYTVQRYRYGDIVCQPERILRELGADLDAGASRSAPRTGGVGREG